MTSLVSQTNDMAHAMFAVFGYKVPGHLKMWRSRHATALLCWKLACGVQKALKGVDVSAILERTEPGVPLAEYLGKVRTRTNHTWVLGVDRRLQGGVRADHCECGTKRDCMPRGAARYYRAGVRCKAGSCPLAVPK